MKSKKLAILALASCSLFLASCSMNKDHISSSREEANKMFAQQALVNQANMPQKLAETAMPQQPKLIPNASASETIMPKGGRVSVHQNPISTFAHNKSVKKAVRSISQVVASNKITNTIGQIVRKPTAVAAAKGNPFEGMNYLKMWIVFLLASIILYVLAALFAAASLPAVLFTVLGAIAGIIFIIFFILWILQLAGK